MKTLVLVITLIVVFSLGYWLGTMHPRPYTRPPIPEPSSGSSSPTDQ